MTTQPVKKLILYVILFFAFALPARAQTVGGSPAPNTFSLSWAEKFLNPAKLNPSRPCVAANINSERFGIGFKGESYSTDERIRICKGLDSFIEHSQKAAAKAGPQLLERMRAAWSIFVEYDVQIIPLPERMKYAMFTASAAFFRQHRAERFQASVFVSAERADDPLFFYALWHELQHIRDIKRAWQNYAKVSNYELEFNAFYLASLLAEVYHPKSLTNGQPTFWKDEWKTQPPNVKYVLRAQAIDSYIKKTEVLKDAWDRRQSDYDFTPRVSKWQF